MEWEKRARAAEAFGTRVVSTRFGLVLGLGGGALGHLVPIFKAFIGGPLGSGKQPQPWIHLDDVAGAILKAIDDETLSGPVNVSAPNPVSERGVIEGARAGVAPAFVVAGAGIRPEGAVR